MKRLNKDVKIFACDFETITEKRMSLNNLTEPYVHLWRVINIYNEKEVYEGTCIDTFMDFLFKVPESKLLYFHNLGYDGTYITPALNDYGLKFVNNLTHEVKKKYNIYSIFETPTGRKIFSMIIKHRDKKTGKKTITIYDSLAILNSSIDKLGETIGIKKHNDISSQKGFYDVDATWYKQDYKQAPLLWRKYLENDTLILARSLVNYFNSILEIQKKIGVDDEHLTQPERILTIGSMFKNITITYMKLIGMEYKKDCMVSLEEYCRASIYYNGGLTTFNPAFRMKGEITSDKMRQNVRKDYIGIGLDINSSYPFQMTKSLPYGKLREGGHNEPDKEGINYYTFYKISFSSCIIKTKYEGFLCLKNNYSWYEGVKKHREYLGESHKLYVSHLRPRKEPYIMYMLKDEWDTLSSIYDFRDVKIEPDFHYKAKPYLKELMKTIYKVRLKCKDKKDDAGTHNYKILMNAGYGKFASRPEFESTFFGTDEEIENIIDNGYTINIFDNDVSYHYIGDIIEHKIDGLRGIKMFKDISPKKIVNVAIGAVITSNARTQLLKEVKRYIDLGCKFVYGDTDSIYFIAPKKLKIKTDERNLGGWKLEKKFVGIMVDRAKRYSWIEIDKKGKEKRINKCAGVGIKATNDDMWNVDIIEDAKLARKFDKRGRVILTSKDIKLDKKGREEELDE